MKKIVFFVWMILGMVTVSAAGDLHMFSVPNADGKVNATRKQNSCCRIITNCSINWQKRFLSMKP